MMDLQAYVFLGVGVAISVLGFFLKKEAKKAGELDDRVKTLETDLAKNEARDLERWNVANKLMEDRREDVQKLFEKLEAKADK
tara:strand:+ start:624 stop:872 length:249 start_codon:yes stop_codon:yes gene_type:complete